MDCTGYQLPYIVLVLRCSLSAYEDPDTIVLRRQLQTVHDGVIRLLVRDSVSINAFHGQLCRSSSVETHIPAPVFECEKSGSSEIAMRPRAKLAVPSMMKSHCQPANPLLYMSVHCDVCIQA
jgi:hypothetical protein